MQAIYEYTGIVETVCELQTFASGFTKQDLVLTDDNDVQTKYPNHIAFSFKKDNTNLLKNVQKAQRAKVSFDIDGSIWQDPKTGKNKYFTDLTALKLELLDADGSSTEPLPDPADIPEEVFAEDTDNLPF